MKIVDLKDNLEYLDAYIYLRNNFANKLCSSIVSQEETKQWILSTSNIIRIVINNNELLGVCILYTEKDNEIAIFTKYHNKGLGGKLLKDIGQVAYINDINTIWAWISNGNEFSLKLFQNNNFNEIKYKIKQCSSVNILGKIYKKDLK